MDSMWNQWLWQLQAFSPHQADPPDPAMLAASLHEDPTRLTAAIAALTRAAHGAGQTPAEPWWLQTLEAIRQLALAGNEAFDDAENTAALEQLHAALAPAPLAQARLLQILAESGQRAALETWVQRIIDQPPAADRYIVLAFSPLFSRLNYDVAWVFPHLLDALQNRRTAPAVLDLANFLVRERMCQEHPAAGRSQELAQLLGHVAQRLSLLEEQPPTDLGPTERQELQRLVSDSVALGVSLCDALALIGDSQVVGKLHQALAPAHRRLRTEAAAAITRLGQPGGAAALVELAAEPVARLRVLHYANELGVLDQVPEQFRSEEARAEATLAAWLAEPMQLGVPPSRLELLDQRDLYWPGSEELEACYLFRFQYSLPNGAAYHNVGISGPLVHAFAANLDGLPLDDLYAAFAGWQAEHEDIYEVPAERFETAHQLEVVRLQRRLTDHGYEKIVPRLLGFFFGQKALVAQAHQGGDAGLAVADEHTIQWLPDRDLQPEDAYCIYKGRQLLRSFNE